MTEEELRKKVKEVLSKASSTKEERQHDLGEVFCQWVPEDIRLSESEFRAFRNLCDSWNRVVAEVVQELSAN